MKIIISGIILVLLSAGGFAVLPILGRYVLVEDQSLALVMFLRFGMAACLLFSVSFFNRFKRFPRGRTLLGLIMIGGGCWVLQSLFYFSALERISASLTTILLYCYPALVIIINAVVHREKISVRQVFSLVLIFLGIVLTLGKLGNFDCPGIAFGLGAGVVYAVYIVAGSNMMKNCSHIGGSGVICASTAMAYGIILLFEQPDVAFTFAQFSGVCAMAFCSTFVAIFCFFAGARRIGVSNAAVISTIEPVLTIVLAIMVLKEHLTLWKFIGASLVVAAVLLNSLPKKIKL